RERRLVDAVRLRELPSYRAQLTLDLLRGLPRHGADVEIDAAVIGIARQPPWQPAADRRDRDVGMLAEMDVSLLESLRPRVDVVAQQARHLDRVDGARLVGQRRVRD